MSNKINKALEKKTIFITGGTSGIGEATAKYLASIGLNVIIFGRSSENGKRIEKQINELGVGSAFFFQGDVTSEEHQRKALEEGEKFFGAIHFAFANAGSMGSIEDLLSVDLKDFKNLMDINFYGAFITLQQVAPYFKKKENGGIIVFNSSMLGLVTRKFTKDFPLFPTYLISKSSVDGLVKVASSLEKSHNIKSYSVNPSVYLSGMTSNESSNPNHLAQKFNLLFKKIGNPTDIAKVLEHIFDGSTKYLSGQSIACENEFTFPSQFFYDKYSTDEDVDLDDLLHNHLRDHKGEKFSQKEILEIQQKIKHINEEITDQNLIKIN